MGGAADTPTAGCKRRRVTDGMCPDKPQPGLTPPSRSIPMSTARRTLPSASISSPAKVRLGGEDQYSPIRSARSESGSIRTWSSSAQGAGRGHRAVHGAALDLGQRRHCENATVISRSACAVMLRAPLCVEDSRTKAGGLGNRSGTGAPTREMSGSVTSISTRSNPARPRTRGLASGSRSLDTRFWTSRVGSRRQDDPNLTIGSLDRGRTARSAERMWEHHRARQPRVRDRVSA